MFNSDRFEELLKKAIIDGFKDWGEMNCNDHEDANKAVVDLEKWVQHTRELTGCYRSGRELKKEKKYKIGFKRKHPELFFDVADVVIIN